MVTRGDKNQLIKPGQDKPLPFTMGGIISDEGQQL